MKVLKKRITSENSRDAIKYCREFANNYSESAELMDLIKKDKMIIHIYEDGTYEFKRIRKAKKT